jgi:hypothetical protein
MSNYILRSETKKKLSGLLETECEVTESLLSSIIDIVVEGINTGDIDQEEVMESVCCECEYKREVRYNR